MDGLITVFRFPIGIIAIFVSSLFFLAVFPLESIVVLVCLPFCAITMTRYEFKNSWVSEWPNSIYAIPVTATKIWDWIFDD